MAVAKLQGSGNLNELVRQATDGMLKTGLSVELIDEAHYQFGEHQFVVQVYEQYFMRAANRLSMTVSYAADGNRISLRCVGAAGGQGPIFKFSWGSEKSMVNSFVAVAERLGFQEV